MVLVKQTEQYRLNTTVGNWSISGTVYKNVNGSISVNATVTFEEEQIGTFNFSKPAEGNVIFNCECAENNRENLSSQANTLISEILTKF